MFPAVNSKAIPVYSLFLFLVLVVLPATVSAQACVQCHTENDQIHQISGRGEKCELCHTDGMTGHIATLPFISNAQAAPASGLTEEQMNRLKLNEQDDVKKMAQGMRYPMYNTPSRLGDKPNEMVMIPAGEFTMGSNERLPDEGPMHKVNLPAYYIDKFEVTNLQYKVFIDATNRRSPRYFRNRTFPEGKADHPVTYVNWRDANAYCEWAGKRLPTEQEWEKAARGTDARTYPWGNTFELHYANTPVRWDKLGMFGDTTPVGSFEKGVSPFGLHDMSGNVWEWTASWYKPHPGNKTPSESYGERYKILKGGSWWDCSFYKCGLSAPVYNRSFFAVNVKNDSFGFRCAKDKD